MSNGHEEPAPSRDDAIAMLWSQHYSGLVRLAVGLTGDVGAAEEIVQDAFAALLRRWGSVRDPSATYAYVLRVVVNGARARWRHRGRGQATSSGTAQAPIVDDDVEARLDVLAALARLPYGKRACLVLRFYADLSQAQVAEVLGISVGTVKSQTAKGLRDLAVVLDKSRMGMR
jgi:RNA polymerase sigma-70 factor (sigma-E family)